MPQPACVVAVSDSRGGGLATFLKNSDLVQSTVVREANFPGSSCVNIHKKFEKTGKKGGKNRRKRVVTRPVYDHLYDGVHADHLTKRQLFLKIAAACRHIIDPKTAEQSGTATEESESDREGWNFKRPRTDYE